MHRAIQVLSEPPLTAPVAVECPKPSYPNPDADGNTIYDNSHYANREKAWERLINDYQIGQSWAVEKVHACESALAEAKEKLVVAAQQRTAAEQARAQEREGSK